MAGLPLDGTRIIEIGDGWVGPWAATLLGDLGAEAVKVESVQRPDMTRGPVNPPDGLPVYPDRQPGPEPWNVHANFYVANRNKRSITLDLTRPEGRRLLYSLVRASDVLLTNLGTGVPEKLGFDYETLCRMKPDIIVVLASGFGSTGPYAGHIAMGGSIDAAAGHTWLRNYTHESPETVSISSYPDTTTGVAAAVAALMALYYRNETGRGQLVDVSACEAFMPQLGEAIMEYTMNGHVAAPRGNGDAHAAPCDVFPCAGQDRWVAICVGSDSEWEALCRAAGHPEWRADPRFASLSERRRNEAALSRLIGEWTAARGPYDVMRALQGCGVAAAPVLDNRDVYHDPHLAARGFFKIVAHPAMRPVALAGPLWKMSEAALGIHRAPPRLGEDNRYVLRELLGVGEAEYTGLERKQIVGQRPLPSIVV